MKAVLTETFLVLQSVLCWLVLLPLAVIICLGVAVRDRVAALLPQRRVAMEASPAEVELWPISA